MLRGAINTDISINVTLDRSGYDEIKSDLSTGNEPEPKFT